ncbi:MAG: DNA polymerase I [Pseudomonadota bacterium]
MPLFNPVRESAFVIVDGSSYLFRAYYALPPLTTSSGQPTGAIRGVVSMLQKLRLDERPQHMVVVFDAPGKNFRHDLFADYKANRGETPVDLKSQIKPLHQVVEALGLPLLCIPDVEADDVIATLALQAAADGQKVLIATSDKDLAQLVNEKITLIDTMKNSRLDSAAVEAKWGVRPDQMADFLSLVGDTSDNVPGVPKVGPKTAATWLQTYGTLDHLISKADAIKGKVGENLRQSLEQLIITRQLIHFQIMQDLPMSWSELKIKNPDKASLIPLYETLEFKALLQQIQPILDIRVPLENSGLENFKLETTTSEIQATEINSDSNREYECIQDEKTLNRWLKALSSSELFSFDLETNSLDYTQADIVGVSFAIEPFKAAYIPLGHVEEATQLNREHVLNALKPLLENPKIGKIGQHLKFDRNVLAQYDINLTPIVHDTMMQSYILNSTSHRHDLQTLAKIVLQQDTLSFEDVAGKGAKQITFDQVSIKQAAQYAAEDADIALRVHHAQWPILKNESRLADIYTDLELPLIPVLSDMEKTGALIDVNLLKEFTVEIIARLADIEKQAFELAGQEFNLSSPKQLGEILYQKLGIPIRKKTPTGAPSTSESVLQELALEFELPSVIVNHRQLTKLKSTYTEKLVEICHPETHRVHTSYHQAITATGRLSSSDPNLQNIPIRTADGRRIRQAFIAPENFVLLSLDYSQIELRIMAHLSDDPGLLSAFQKDQDVHRATAAEIFSVTTEEVTKEQRRQAKTVNFGLIYGMSAFGLAQQLGIPRHLAQVYIDTYFLRYPGVKKYMERTRAEAHSRGYVETILGRRLYLEGLQTGTTKITPAQRNALERAAINAPLQGTAADIIKKSMIEVDAWLKTHQPQARLILQVHDELVIEVPEKDITAVKKAATKIMQSVYQLKVPLIVDSGSGKNWSESH